MIIIIVFIVGFAVWYLVKVRYERFLESDPTVVRLKAILAPAFPELNGLKVMKGDASYTINKSKIYLCTEYGDEKYDDNMMTYVLLHELAHTITPSIGHGEEFQLNFHKLLARAERHRLFDPAIPRVENYCKA